MDNQRFVALYIGTFVFQKITYWPVNIFLLDHIRAERAFENFDQLKKQIALDADAARQFHQNNTGLI